MKLVRFLYDKAAQKGALSGGVISVEGSGEEIRLDDVLLLPPVKPSKVVLVGLNYRDHAKELDMPIPEEPVIFIKPSTAVTGPSSPVIYPKSAERVDYEAELGIVIKDITKSVSASEALEHVAGYTCVNDITARDLQKKDGQWTRAKSFDTFAPVGPWIETELDPSDLRITSFLNGHKKQDSRTSNLIFPVPRLIEFISDVMTLLPGDVIATGTPPGVGPLKPGDEIAVEVEGIGRLVNTVEAAT